MNALSLVPAYKIEKDPRNLAYLFPSMPASRYKQQTEEFYHLKTIRWIEDVAKMIDKVIVPAHCIHWQRKKRLKRFNVRIFRNSYYVVSLDELTEKEVLKYRSLIESP